MFFSFDNFSIVHQKKPSINDTLKNMRPHRQMRGGQCLVYELDKFFDIYGPSCW